MTYMQEVLAVIGTASKAETDTILTALTERRKYLRTQASLENQVTLTPGTAVVTQYLKPKYLAGLTGRVLDEPGKRKGDLMVQIDERWRETSAHYGGDSGKLSVPAQCLRERKV